MPEHQIRHPHPEVDNARLRPHLRDRERLGHAPKSRLEQLNQQPADNNTEQTKSAA